MKTPDAPIAPGITSLLARAVLITPLLACLASCGAFSPMQSEDREALSTCRADTDRVFAAQNRYQLSERNQSDSPYAANTLPSNPNAGLADQYQQDQMVNKCMARSAAGQPSDH